MKKLNGGYIGVDFRRVEGGVITLTKHLLERQDDKFGSSEAQRLTANYPNTIQDDLENIIVAEDETIILFNG